MKPHLLVRIEHLASEVDLIDEYQTVSVYLDMFLLGEYHKILDEFMILAPAFLKALLQRQRHVKFDNADRNDSYYPEKWMKVWKDITHFAIHVIEIVNSCVDEFEVVLSFDYTRSITEQNISEYFHIIKYANDYNNYRQQFTVLSPRYVTSGDDDVELETTVYYGDDEDLH